MCMDGRCMHQKAGDVCMSKDRYAQLTRHYLSPLDGIRDIAVGPVSDWGYDPADHLALMDELAIAVTEALIETCAAVMREHGLKGPADTPREDPHA